VSCVVILANIVVMALEVQYRGKKIGYENRFIDGTFDAESWPHAETIFTILDLVFNTIFAIEVILRMAAWRLKAFHSVWINLDIIIVSTSLLQAAGFSLIDPRMIRVVRLVRMIRMLKIVRVIRIFDSMFLLVRSIQASAGAFLWSFILLFFIQLAAGMLLHQLVKPYLTDATVPVNLREGIYRAFGTFTGTMLTMFEITFANWVPVCRLLVDNVAEVYGLFFVVYRCMFCFAVIKVIAAVFISETNRIVASDDHLAVVKSQRAREDFTRKLKTMFRMLDESGDGQLSWGEFQHLVSDEVTKSWANAMEIDTRELEELFAFLDTGNGMVSLDEFMDGIPKMRGAARSMEVMHILFLTRRMEQKLSNIQRTLGNHNSTREDL